MDAFSEYFTSLRGKRIAVLGLGVSNRPLVRLLLEFGCDVTGCDKTPREELEQEVLELEKAGCANPDEPAGAFGAMMAQLLTVADDLWAPTLRQLGDSLGRFIYLLDAALDYDKDKRKGKYNPYLAMGTGKDWPRWEEYLVLAMGRCTDSFERLPLVQDKAILDNILYSGVWMNYRRKRKEEDQPHD